jgi:isochorismate synthase
MTTALETLSQRLNELADRWDGRSRRLLSATIETDLRDPVGAVAALRLASDRWFAWEEPDRDFAIAGLGSAVEVVSRGSCRFDDVSRDCAAFLQNRIADEPTGLPAGAGPLWTGGFAFAADGGASAPWSSLPPALFVMPEIAIAREGERTFITASVYLQPGTVPDALITRIGSRLSAIADTDLPMLDPAASGRVSVSSALPPSHFEDAVAAAVARIRQGDLEKVVLAREVRAEAPRAHDPAALFGALRELFPSCYCFCVGTPEAAFIGASPELLVRRRGAGAQTVALAGSTRRSADPAVDDHLGEQLARSAKNRSEHEIVVRRIERSLRPHSVWVEAAREPVLIKVANIQHLATPIHAQLADPRSAVELAGLLHPTPAVGGEPGPRAVDVIAELEELDRGWYAGPVGWMDATEDGEFCVALRSALLRDRTAHLIAGGGIVADSDPEAELAETELKLGALLPLVSG